MKLRRMIRKVGRRLKRSSPTILSVIAAGGVVATAILTAKETPKAVKLMEQAKYDRLTKTETFLLVAPAYLPAAGAGLGTIICIFGANALNRRQQAGLMSAYALLERSYRDYKSKAVQMLGKDGAVEIANEIVKDELAAKPVEVKADKPLFYDVYEKRYFNATLEEVREAEYELNRKFALNGDVSLNDFYHLLGLKKTKQGKNLGWNITINVENYDYPWIDFSHQTIMTDDGLECTIIYYPFEPTLYYSAEYLD